MSEELLVTCPLCQRPNFSPRGLKAHRCKQNGRKPLHWLKVNIAIQKAINLKKGVA